MKTLLIAIALGIFCLPVANAGSQYHHKIKCASGYSLKGSISDFYCKKYVAGKNAGTVGCPIGYVFNNNEYSSGADKCVTALGRSRYKKAGCLPGFEARAKKRSRDRCYTKSYTYYSIPLFLKK
ncbi:MAG: hypothetical protein HOE90_00555 [Bacteriovoracaceae bacterium]|jgi:hypothetical protein|nr:hypothetical protein [Bacteriovoracaceae bacterium]